MTRTSERRNPITDDSDDSATRAVRRSLVIVVWSVLVGVILGGCFGVFTIAWAALADSSAAGVGVSLMVAAIFGALIGMAVALPTSIVWIILTHAHVPHWIARWTSAITAAAVVLILSLVLTQDLGWFAAVCAAAAGLTAAGVGPLLGYQRQKPPKTSSNTQAASQ